jgi:hypothetical protein
MRMLVRVATVLAAGVLGASCSSQGPDESGAASSPPSAAPSPAGSSPPVSPASGTRGEPSASERPGPVEVLRGTLGGDAQLEGGCTWLELGSGERLEVLYPPGYQVSADPVRLVGPDGEEVAAAGDALEIEVAARPEMLTICQVGPVVEAGAVRPG